MTQWDTITAYYDKWTRPKGAGPTVGSGFEWFCPMHPSIVRDNPKEKCPICFMPLSRRKKGESHAEPLPAGVVNRVQLSPYRVVLAGAQTWPVDYRPLSKEIAAVGYVEFNERGQRTVAARVAGRIDDLYANETGRMVHAGDLLASLYSPDLVVSVQNMLDAKRAGDTRNQASSRRRLELLGIDDAQLDAILASDKADTHMQIRSPISGHIINKYVREGQYVEQGMPLYDLADLSTVWIEAQVYEDDLAFLPQESFDHSQPFAGANHGEHGKQGDASATADADMVIDDSAGGRKQVQVTATSRAFPSEVFRGTLSFIYPHADQNTRTVSVRFEVDNPRHRLRPGNTATVSFKVLPKDVLVFGKAAEAGGVDHQKLLAGEVLAVPESAVIDTGQQKIVYRQASPGVFEGVKVALGPRMQDDQGVAFFPVLEGLARGERVVTAGSFLVDAETRLNPAAGSIYFGGSSGSKGQEQTTVVRPSTPEDPDAERQTALAKLAPEDRPLAEAQRKCPVLDTDLGSMGKPVKLVIDGETVFLCCQGCEEEARKNAAKTVDAVRRLRALHGGQLEAKP
jgi:Cu(I)/Ag(I) efflux system membrane fusion protein